MTPRCTLFARCSLFLCYDGFPLFRTRLTFPCLRSLMSRKNHFDDLSETWKNNSFSFSPSFLFPHFLFFLSFIFFFFFFLFHRLSFSLFLFAFRFDFSAEITRVCTVARFTYVILAVQGRTASRLRKLVQRSLDRSG